MRHSLILWRWYVVCVFNHRILIFALIIIFSATTTTAAAAAPSTTTPWSNFSSNFASLASLAAASVQSVVESADAQVLGNVPSSSSHSSSAAGGGFSTASTLMPSANTAAATMTYQERQRLLHQQYHASNAGVALNNSNTAPSNIVPRLIQTSLSTTSSLLSLSRYPAVVLNCLICVICHVSIGVTNETVARIDDCCC